MSALKNPVGWFEIHVSDLLRAKQFYETLFNQHLQPLPSDDPSIEMMVFGGDLTSHGTTGALVKHPMKQPSTEGVRAPATKARDPISKPSRIHRQPRSEPHPQANGRQGIQDCRGSNER